MPLEYKVRPEALIRQLLADYSRPEAVRRLSIILETNDKARQAFSAWAIARYGQTAVVPHEGKVS